MDRLSLIHVKEELGRREISIFSLRDFIRIFKVQPKTARAFLSYHSTKGVLKRAKRGIYISTSNPPTKFEVANYLHRPSYVSFESALSYYKIIPETVYSVTSATTKSAKGFSFQNIDYQYRKIKKELFFGFEPVKIRDRVILIADREKAVLDYLYLLSLKKQSVNERINLSKIDKKKFGKYIKYFKKRVRKANALINIVKELNL